MVIIYYCTNHNEILAHTKQALNKYFIKDHGANQIEMLL